MTRALAGGSDGGKLMFKRLAVIAMLIGLPTMAGCAVSDQHAGMRRQRPARDILFGSRATWGQAEFIGRSDWPATTAYVRSAEQVETTTTIFDRQEPSEHGRDHLSRTFRSIRTGRARR